MPNWCYNVLIVEGLGKDVERFLVENAGDGQDVLSFARHLPCPNVDLSDTEQYWWRILKWGTKWDISGGSIDNWVGEGWVKYEFDTPWNPPLPWLKSIAAAYPTLTFSLEYHEPGGDDRGSMYLEGGNVGAHVEYQAVEAPPSYCQGREHRLHAMAEEDLGRRLPF